MPFLLVMLFSQSAYAGERGSAVGSLLLAERQAGEVRVVLYMTTW